MILSLSFVYFGIKHYKNNDLDGEIEFKTAFVIGFGITSFAAIAFGLIDAIYISTINPNFSESYIAYEFGLLEAQQLTELEIHLNKEAILKRSEVYENSTIVFFVTLMMVLVIGTIISLLSALILHKKEN